MRETHQTNPTQRVSEQQPDDGQLDPAVEQVRRRLMRLMISSMAITMVLLLIVLGAIIYKISTSHDEGAFAEGAGAQNTALTQPLILPQGAAIISQSISGDRLSLHIRQADGRQYFYFYDYRRQQPIATLEIKSAP